MEQFELPANIKQIGSIGDGPRIYMEDYAYTYLAQYAESGGYNERLAFLIGRRIVIDGAPVLFISAAAQGKHCDVKNGLTVFTQKSKDYAQEAIRQYFPGHEVVGWMQSQPSYGTAISAPYLQYHLDNFTDPDQVMFVMDPIEKVNAFYVRSKDNRTLDEASGYFIYYDKNRAMHEYMLDNKITEPRVRSRAEPGLDPAAFLSRSKKPAEPKISVPRFLTERSKRADGSGAMDQRRMLNLAVSLCAVLFVVCFIMGAGLIQNQDRISGMERQLVDLSTAYRDLGVQLNQGAAAQAFMVQPNEDPPGDGADLITEDGAQNLNDHVARNQEKEPPEQNPVDSAEAAAEADNAQSGQQGPQPTASALDDQAAAGALTVPQFYTVEAGDSLSSISEKFYGHKNMVGKIMEINGMDDPDLIYSGAKIALPQPDAGN